MIKQGTIYSTVVNFINSYKLGETYTSEDFKNALEEKTYGSRRCYNGQWYRVRTYQTYLKSAGFITNVRKGVWRINYHVPHWMSLYALETLRGYKEGYWNGREYVRRPDTFRNELAARLKAYKQSIDKDGVEESSPEKPIGWKIGDRIKITEDQPIFTIESFTDSSQESINLTWVDSRSRKQSLEYTVSEVNECVARDGEYKWKVQQDTNKRIMKCIDAGGYELLTTGKYYEILEDDGKYYELLDNNNTLVHMFKTRFTEIKTPQQDTKKTWKVGDTLSADLLNGKPHNFHGLSGYSDRWVTGQLNYFIGDRQILEIKDKDGRRAALISGTSNIWIEIAAIDSMKVPNRSKTPQQDTIKDIPKDRLLQFLEELETLIAKYK